MASMPWCNVRWQSAEPADNYSSICARGGRPIVWTTLGCLRTDIMHYIVSRISGLVLIFRGIQSALRRFNKKKIFLCNTLRTSYRDNIERTAFVLLKKNIDRNIPGWITQKQQVARFQYQQSKHHESGTKYI